MAIISRANILKLLKLIFLIIKEECNNNKTMQTSESIIAYELQEALKAELSESFTEIESLRSRLFQAESAVAYWKNISERACTRAAVAEKRLRELTAAAASAGAEERVDREIAKGKSPHAKLKIMALMVGIPNTSNMDYKKLWKTVIMTVHCDKRVRMGLSVEMDALYECVCKRVNALPKR